MTNKILIIIHFPANIGYAVEKLERVFYAMALIVTGDKKNVFFAYTSLENGYPTSLPDDFKNIFQLDIRNPSKKVQQKAVGLISANKIDTILGFDISVSNALYKPIRKAGVKHIVSYQGAPMSSPNSGLKLLYKRLDVLLTRYKPNSYIFESEAMRETAVRGRGIRACHTCVVPPSVDVEQFRNYDVDFEYAHSVLGIPGNRKIIIYSGHMEERKGAWVIINAAMELVNNRGITNYHFLFCGNKDGEEAGFIETLGDTPAKDFVVFGGYRNDMAKLMPCAHIGVIATTGWDSFTLSTLEMAASGLPRIVSNIQGLAESVEDGKDGFLFTPKNHIELVEKILMLEDSALHQSMSEAARKKVTENFTFQQQCENLAAVIRDL